MSIFQMLLLFGLPVVGFFAFLMWRGRPTEMGWKPRPVATRPAASASAAPTAMVAQEVPDMVSDKVQDEIAALRRVSASLRPPPASASNSSETFNIPARWEIRYADSYGDLSDRVIRVQHVNLRSMEIAAYCELRRGQRTFKIRNIKQATDPRTGAGINVKAYIEQVRAGRRASRGRFR